jgi:site-specific recombinase XerC
LIVVMTVMPVAACGPLAGAVMDRLAAWIAAEGYAQTMAPQILGVARGLSAWMADQHVGLDALSVGVLEEFEAAYPPGAPGHQLVRMRLPALRRFLIETGHLREVHPVRKRPRRPGRRVARTLSAAAEQELEEWARWQREVRGISGGCIGHRRQWIGEFVESLTRNDAVDWHRCDVNALNGFVGWRSHGFSAASCTGIVDALRSLMRWALATGRLQRDLTGGILRARASRVTLPRGLSVPQIEALLAACDVRTVSAVRDRAVITALWRLGLRAGEAASLMLDDLDWAAGRLSVVGKNQRRLTLPLPVDLGEALVAWLRVRPSAAADRALFVRLRPPNRRLSSAGISDIVKHRAEAASLGVVHAHRLRHSAAMNVIATGGSLLEAQELLGHRSVSSTRVYARTDLVSLQTLIVAFGQVPR